MSTNLHPKFQINGHYTNREDLIEIAYSLIKEGNDEEQKVGDFLLDWLSEDDTITVTTSGSTGTPKQIVLQKIQMVNSAKATIDFFNLEEGDSALLCLSAQYIAGKMMLVRAMVGGLSLDIVPPSSDPLRFLDKSYDFCAMVPMQVKASLDKLSQLKTLIIGGAPINTELLKKLEKSGHQNCFETYGMTETITHIALKRLSKENSDQPMPFAVLPGITIGIDNRNCLIINAPLILENSMITNDIVEMVSEKEFNWLGRYDNIINSGGIKLFPEIIEKKLGQLIPLKFFISSIPDEVLGEKVVLILEGDKTDAYHEAIEKAGLSNYEKPKELFFLPKFKMSQNGKILRTKTLSAIFKI
ncbi:MAG: AMP-binding protein [Eudoraea sp.]